MASVHEVCLALILEEVLGRSKNLLELSENMQLTGCSIHESIVLITSVQKTTSRVMVIIHSC